MTLIRPSSLWRGGFWAALLIAVLFALPALADPKFPPLTGRVVDDAHLLSPEVQRDLTTKLETLESTTGRQLVVATVPDLQGYPIEDYGYQLGRTWGIGEKDKNTGAILLVAPSDRKVRIEVGYGLEPVLTDALSSVIIQSTILPKFRDGDMSGGIVDGTNAIVQQLSLPDDQAKVRVAEAAQPERQKAHGSPLTGLFIAFFLIIVFSSLFRGGRRGGLGSALPWIILGALNSGGRSSGGGSDWGGGGGGGGGFSGGGGSFGGGGSSGSW